MGKTAIARYLKTACICDLVTEPMDFIMYTDSIIGKVVMICQRNVIK